MSLKINEEVKKQFDANFLAIAGYPEWVTNIVPVPKKDGKVRMCMDYQDLNRVSPKDNFPLPHIDVIVDNMTSFALFSFMDGFLGYNQIKMPPSYPPSKNGFFEDVLDGIHFGHQSSSVTQHILPQTVSCPC